MLQKEFTEFGKIYWGKHMCGGVMVLGVQEIYQTI